MASNSQIAHLWAQQRHGDKDGGNMFFRGPTIYSYGTHFPMARFTAAQDPDGAQVVLYTSGSYSKTTAKHLSLVRNALAGLPVRVFTVPDVDPCNATDHAANVAHMLAARAELLDKAARAVSRGADYLADAATLAHDATLYAVCFDLPAPVIAEPSADVLAIVAGRATVAQKRAVREYAAERAEWLAGTRRSMPAGYNGPTLLRLAFTAGNAFERTAVETSRGATVPRDVAPRLWAMACDARSRGSAQHGGGRAVGGFTLDMVSADGSLRIGCHVLTWEVISDFCVRVLGLPAYVEREPRDVATDETRSYGPAGAPCGGDA